MGFLQRAHPAVQTANDVANNGATLFGAADAGVQVLEHSIFNLFDDAANGARGLFSPAGSAAADAASGLPGSKLLGHAGGALAALGLANDVHDMTQNGINVDNGLSATGNGLGLGAWAAGTFGAAGGGAATVAAPLMAAGAGGLAVGGLMNRIADSSYAMDEHGQGTDDRWQQSIIDDAIANGEDPTSTWNIIKGGAAGTAGQLVDTARGIGNWVGSWFD